MTVSKVKFNSTSPITLIDDALDSANLNFIAQEHQLMTDTLVDIPNHKAIVRGDTNQVLGVVGSKYTPTQNSLSFSFMDALVKKHGYHYTESVSKGNGAVSIITAQSTRPDVIRVGDEVARQIKLINGFNGKVGMSIEFSMLRLVCSNGMVKSERESIMRFKHTINVADKLQLALAVFDESISFHESFIAESKRLAQISVDKQMVEVFLGNLFSDSKQNDKKKSAITDLFQHGQGNKGETLWDLVNGTTEWVDHYASSDDKRLDYSTFGAGHKLKEKAWEIGLSMIA